MSLKQSEAIVLRTYPLHEADLLVTLFTRVEGKVRGVARSAKKSKRRFGGSLEPLTYVRAFYDVREPFGIRSRTDHDEQRVRWNSVDLVAYRTADGNCFEMILAMRLYHRRVEFDLDIRSLF